MIFILICINIEAEQKKLPFMIQSTLFFPNLILYYHEEAYHPRSRTASS